MNLKTIADAIATTVGTVVATNGTETETATATADLPDSVAKVALLVYPPVTADLAIDMGPHLDDQYDFVLRLLRDPLHTPPRIQWLYAWATVLRVRIQTDWDLGVSGVTQAEATSMRVEINGQQYSSPDGTFDAYDVVEMTVRVWVYELTTIS